MISRTAGTAPGVIFGTIPVYFAYRCRSAPLSPSLSAASETQQPRRTLGGLQSLSVRHAASLAMHQRKVGQVTSKGPSLSIGRNTVLAIIDQDAWSRTPLLQWHAAVLHGTFTYFYAHEDGSIPPGSPRAIAIGGSARRRRPYQSAGSLNELAWAHLDEGFALSVASSRHHCRLSEPESHRATRSAAFLADVGAPLLAQDRPSRPNNGPHLVVSQGT